MEINIRAYRTADLARLKEITVEAFDGVSIDQNVERQFGTVGGHDWWWHKTRQIDHDVRRDAEGIFVAESEGKVIGYITTWLDPAALVGYIPNMAVSRECRGSGIGRKLVEHALSHFRQSGMCGARIETLEQNEVGQNVYPKLDFREVARQIHYFRPLDSPARKT